MAIGDIVSVTVNPTAWQAEILISGMSWSGNYSMGFGQPGNIVANNSPKITLNLTSSGFNSDTTPTTISRIIYGTTGIRHPYPNNLSKDEFRTGNNVIVKVGLSDYIYSGDRNITYNILSGFYFSGAISNTLSTGTVINNSNIGYAKPIANWSIPNYQRIGSGQTLDLKCVAFSRFAQQGQQVRCVRFVANDEHNNYVTGTATSESIDSTAGDIIPIVEYIKTIPTTSLTTGDAITGNFTVYPWVGDANSILSTTDGLNARPTQNYAPINFLCDKSGNYGISVAVIDSVTGNNNVGQVIDITAFNPANPPTPFLTIHSGARAISVYNNLNRSRNDVGGGILYLKSGNHFWTSGSTTYGNTPKTHLILTPLSGHLRKDTIISDSAGDKGITNRVRVSGVKITSNATITFSDIESLWFDNCEINSPSSTALVYQGTYWAATKCLIPDMNQGIRPFGDNPPPVLVRSCHLSGFANDVYTNTVIGNLRTSGASNQASSILDIQNSKIAGQTPIFAFNIFYNLDNSTSSPIETYQVVPPNFIGAAYVQNVLECRTNQTQAIAKIFGDGSSGISPNILIYHNDFVGQRSNIGYDDDYFAPRHQWAVKNNIFDDYNCKTDTFSPESSVRTGNWALIFGVGYAGNAFPETSGIGAAGQFNNEFNGLSWVGAADTQSVSSTSYLQFKSRASFNGVTGGSGNGNYNLSGTSPIIGYPIDWVLSHDLNGATRYSGDAPGAYTVVLAVTVNDRVYSLGRIQKTVIRPHSDISLGSWTQSPLFSKINEVSPDDSNYVSSVYGPSSDSFEVALTPTGTPIDRTTHNIRYRLAKNGTVRQIDMIVGLYEGASLIASGMHINIPNGTFATGFSLTNGEASTITDYGNLRLRFTANTI